MSKLNPTQLELHAYNQPNWHKIVDRNFEIVNWYLQKLERMTDVSPTVPALKKNDSLLRWSASEGKWVIGKGSK